ncbi:phosphatase PAP2 family protein [Sphingomonas sinipercae]|uniref:Phosphatase PAP2 family protein n=1 Tax=Sphingomonas sinipercae TaxID=2714944 RepID=A0A6G7ZLI7_9SPHN|nr:phosphatase PAP2 family protein [Sphingomonas sinipercae]QIL01841.1 phosphatase PAP2 family protein [Sphingomonas sinipercae]
MAKTKDKAERVVSWDARIADAAAEYRDTPPVRLWSRFAKLGDQPELRAISGAVIAAGVLLGRGKLFRAGLRMLLAHEAATSAKSFIKHRVDRTRPRSADDARDARPKKGHSRAKRESSFPSGHSAGAIAVASAFARDYPQHRVPALAAAGLVAVGQIPKNAHYPTDVAAGALIGAATEALIALAWRQADTTLQGSDEGNDT